MGCLYQHTCIAWCLGRNGKLLKFLSILIATVYFKDRNRISKTGHCISCSMVCKIIFCSEFLNIPDKAGRKTSLHIAKQSVMRFTQMQQRIVYQCKGHHLLKTNINTFVVIFIFRRLIDVKRLQAFVNSEVSAWVPQTKINTWNWALKAIFTFKSLFLTRKIVSPHSNICGRKCLSPSGHSFLSWPPPPFPLFLKIWDWKLSPVTERGADTVTLYAYSKWPENHERFWKDISWNDKIT